VSKHDEIEWVIHEGLKNTGLMSAEDRGTRIPPHIDAATYTPKGKLYPRLTLCLKQLDGGYTFFCSIKWCSKGRWGTHNLPPSLVPVVARMWSRLALKLLREKAHAHKMAEMKADKMTIADMVPRRLYRIDSRNLSCGVWNPKNNGFIGIRTKFGSRFLATEYRPPFGTASPKEDLGLDIPEGMLLREHLPGSWSNVDGEQDREVEFKTDDPTKQSEPGHTGKWFYKGTDDEAPNGGCLNQNKALFDWLEANGGDDA